MKLKYFLKKSVAAIIFVGLLFSCSGQESLNYVVVGLTSDVSTFNPMFARNADEGEIIDILYLGLVGHFWDENINNISDYNQLAENIIWSEDRKSVKVKLKDDIFWSDGVEITVDDFIYSYLVYSDPRTGSSFLGMFDNYQLTESGKIDSANSFVKIDNKQFEIKFDQYSNPSIYDIDLPLIPMHVYEGIPNEELASSNENFNPVVSGAYKLKEWKREQSIILEANKLSQYYETDQIQNIVFKISADYNIRLLQLQSGELDIIQSIKPDDVKEVELNESIRLESRVGREFDFLGWSNVSIDDFQNGKIKPHRLFGNPNIRRALTIAIDRGKIFKEYLNTKGEIASGPISPIFQKYVDPEIHPLTYNADKAIEIIHNEGWVDSDNDGWLDKNKENFEFTLTIPGGSPRRSYVAKVVKNNLKNIGIKVNVEILERSVFYQKIFSHQAEAFLSGWMIAFPLNLMPYWHSDYKQNQGNLVCYSNSNLDKILEKLDSIVDEKEKQNLYYSANKIIQEDQPVTFLFWLNKNVGINKRIKNITFDPLGTFQQIWKWRLEK